MRLRSFLSLLVTCLAVFLALPTQAQWGRTQAEEGRMQELVDQLKGVIRKAERNRTADLQLLQELRDLTRRYDWPWRVELLYDDFRDGDYTDNPAWVVDSGDFRVLRGLGLRTQFTPPAYSRRGPSQRQGEDLGTAILGAVLSELQRREEGGAQPTTPAVAEIHTKLHITNAFAMKLRITWQGGRDGDGLLGFGPYRGERRDEGYRLVYNAGQKPTFELRRLTPGRSAVIEVYDRAVQLEDGRTHSLEWRRNDESEMVVLLDGKVLMQATDRAFRDSFDGFTLVNRGGDYAFRQIEIFGTHRRD